MQLFTVQSTLLIRCVSFLLCFFCVCRVCAAGPSTWHKANFLQGNKVLIKWDLIEYNVTSLGRGCACMDSVYQCFSWKNSNQQLVKCVCVWFSVGCSHSAAPSSSQHSCHVEAQCLWGPHLLVGVWNALFLLAHTQNKHTLALRDIHTQTLSIYIDMEALSDIPCLISIKYPDCCSCSWNVQNFSADCVKTRTGPEDREA